MEKTKKYLSLTECATLTGRSYWMLRNSVLSGALRASQLTPRGKIYVTRSSLDDLFDNNTVSPLSVKAGAI